jgi:DNA-binding transcriptional LysR family regulator
MSQAPTRYFLEVVRCGSIRVASARLNVVPSALSRQIQNLETELGVPLFERRPRGMALTAAGEVYARYAQAVALESERMRSDLEELRGLRRGVIRIATVEGVVADSMTSVIASFRAKHPGIRFNLITLGTDHVVAAVRDNRVDIGVSFHAQPDAAVRFVRRYRDPLMALVHPDNPLATRRKVALREVLSMPIAVPESGFGIRRLIDEQCRRLGESLVPALETNSIEALRGFARSGAGVTFLPGNSFQREIRQGEAVSIPLADRLLNQCSMDFGVLAGRYLPTTISQFLTLLDLEFSAARDRPRRQKVS